MLRQKNYTNEERIHEAKVLGDEHGWGVGCIGYFVIGLCGATAAEPN
jgi:hypothetical protein